jgi:electron transport complex protein RnfB
MTKTGHALTAPNPDAIDALLPQTQCGKCGYNGCRPYAEAIAKGEADINQCPPGGDAGVQALAALLGQPAKPLNPEYGEQRPVPVAAWIDEAICIGCTRCIQACPVDAIVGASKQMHTIITAECTGCELCIPPCPVDCIHLREITPDEVQDEQQARVRRRERFQWHEFRLARDTVEQAERRRQKKEALAKTKPQAAPAPVDPRKAYIAAALERVKQKKAAQLALASEPAAPDRDKP